MVKLYPFSELKVIELEDINEVTLKIIEEVKKVFKELLNSNDDIDINAHFNLDLGGTSLDYLTLLVKLEEKYDIKFNNIEPFYTVLQFSNYIVGKIN